MNQGQNFNINNAMANINPMLNVSHEAVSYRHQHSPARFLAGPIGPQYFHASVGSSDDRVRSQMPLK